MGGVRRSPGGTPSCTAGLFSDARTGSSPAPVRRCRRRPHRRGRSGWRLRFLQMRSDASKEAGTPGISLPACSAGRPSSGSRAGTASHTSLSRIFVRFSILTPMTSETGSASGARDCADRRRGYPAFIRLAARERNHLNHRPNTDGGAKGTPPPRSASSTHPGSGPTPMAGTRDFFFISSPSPVWF